MKVSQGPPSRRDLIEASAASFTAYRARRFRVVVWMGIPYLGITSAATS